MFTIICVYIYTYIYVNYYIYIYYIYIYKKYKIVHRKCKVAFCLFCGHECHVFILEKVTHPTTGHKISSSMLRWYFQVSVNALS